MPEDEKFLTTIIVERSGFFVTKRILRLNGESLVFATLKGRKKRLPCCCNFRSSCCVCYVNLSCGDTYAEPVPVCPPQDPPGCICVPFPTPTLICDTIVVARCFAFDSTPADQKWRFCPDAEPTEIDRFNTCEDIDKKECEDCRTYPEVDPFAASLPCGRVMKYSCADTEDGAQDDGSCVR
jgi:hypothetical protein